MLLARLLSVLSTSKCLVFPFWIGLVLAGPLVGEDARALASETTDAKRPFEAVRSNILDAMEKTGVASITVAVAKDGEIVWEEGFGWADRENEIKATPHTVYHLASISKPITATGLMLLVERGLVDLDKPANDYLGDSKLSAFAGNADDATVRRILAHTSGLPTYWNFFTADGSDERPAVDESIRRYGLLVTVPGETYTYSNFGYGILDYIMSRVSGKDYSEFMREEVFGPLGMMHTSVQVDVSQTGDVARMYGGNNELIAPYDFDHRGASAVLSCVHDLVRFGIFHLDNGLSGQKPILKKETMTRMNEEVVSKFHDEGGTDVDYLLGSFAGVELGGYRFLVASGGMPGAVSRLTMVPSANVVTALLCNGDNIDLWPIEKVILETMLENFGDETKTENDKGPDETAVSKVPPESIAGSWAGRLQTYVGEFPVEMDVATDGVVSMKMAGKPLSPIDMNTPLGEMGFKKNAFKGLFLGKIDTPDAARSRHVVLVECACRDGRLVGTVSAVAMNRYFCLPHFLELSRNE